MTTPRDACGPAFGYRPLGEEGYERLHTASLRLLETVGVEVRDERGRVLLAGAGAVVESVRVRIPRQVIEQALESLPKRFTLRGRAADGSLDLDVAPGCGYYGNGTDCLCVIDPLTGVRRRAVVDDVETIAAGCELLPQIDFVMSAVLPADAPLTTLDLAQFAAMLKGTRKPIVISSAEPGTSVPAMVEMAALAGGTGSFACLAMSNPPLVLDAVCVGKALACAELGVPFICGPGNQMGATGPASVAGSLAVGHAETLAALTVHQLAGPGAPALYGAGAASVMDMHTMVDLWGTPEGVLADAVSCHLAARLGLPSWSFAGTSESKLLDGQWAAETVTTLLLASLTEGTLFHDVGELEAGVQSSLDSVILGNELIDYVRRIRRGIVVDDDTLQLDDIALVGPGGDYLARPYTRRHHREMWRSDLFDTAIFDHWQAAGATTLRQRLREKTIELVRAREPLLDARTSRALDAFWTGG